MDLFPDRLVDQTLKMPGAGHSFLKHLCHPDASNVRAGLQELVAQQPTAIQTRYLELLQSLDNRRFYQGFSELSCIAALNRAGWKATSISRPCIELKHNSFPTTYLSVLAFLQQRRPGGEEGLHKRLTDTLNRASAKYRFAVLIRRWLPPELDPEPIRRAVELWQNQVTLGQWQGRYATYEDDKISLEFSLTGETTGEGVAPGPDRQAVAFCLGPFFAHRSMEAIEPRVIAELDRYRTSELRKHPLILACATDQRWLINNNYLLEFFYGRPSQIVCEEGQTFREYSGNGVCIFRDPFYPMLSGIWMVDREPAHPTDIHIRSFLNPWAQIQLSPESVTFKCFTEVLPRQPPSSRWLGWENGRGTCLRLGD